MAANRVGWAEASRRIAAAGEDAPVLEEGSIRTLRVSRLRREMNSILRRREVIAIEQHARVVAMLEPVESFSETMGSSPDVGEDEDLT